MLDWNLSNRNISILSLFFMYDLPYIIESAFTNQKI